MPAPSPARPRNRDALADVITHPRISRFEIAGSGAEPATWRIQLGLPEAPSPEAGYPVIYMLDGNATFPLAWQAAEASGLGPVVLVGVGYEGPHRYNRPRRYYDLTSAVPPESMRGDDGAEPPRTGGRAVFLDFLARDLLPEMERRLPLDSARRTLFGHSLGGLFTLYALFTRPALFRTYVASDPSIWWGWRAILQDMRAFLASPAAAHTGKRDVLIETSKGGRRSGQPAPPGRNLPNTDGPGARDVAAALAGAPSLRVFHRHFPDEDHGSMLPFSAADALRLTLGSVPAEITLMPAAEA